MARYIRPVSPDLLIQANAKIAADREKYGSPDVEVSIVTGFADDHDVDELIAVSYRLRALAKVLRNGDSNHWTLNVGNKEYKLVSEALFLAAAKTRSNRPRPSERSRLMFGSCWRRPSKKCHQAERPSVLKT